MTRLRGKTALITGAARGIGRASAERYVAEGAKVAIADIDLDRAQTTASEVGCIAIEMDVACHKSIAKGVASAIEPLGQIDILINNAAVSTATPTTEIAPDDFYRVMDINVAGTPLTMQTVGEHMINRNIKGRIINMANQAGRHGEPLVTVYCASQARSAGLNLIANGINVNATAPGVVDGGHWDGVEACFTKYENKPRGQKKAEVGAAVPYARMGTAEDLTGMAVVLASDDAAYVAAQTSNVDGGN